jgi:hypothetical protein
MSRDKFAMKVESVRFSPNATGMDWTLKNPAGTVGLHMKKISRKIVFAAKAQAGVRTGLLKFSIHGTQERTATGQLVKIGSNLPYALVHHEGSRPHMIRGRNGGMVRFTQSSRVVYSRAVMHPGTRPNKYLADNLWLALT